MNDSVIADPQFTITLLNDSGHSLCYEIHGDSDNYYNLISDTCLSVNAHFTAINSVRNAMSKIGIRAVSETGGCVDVE